MNAQEEKQKIREEVWDLLMKEGASLFPGARGRVPNFKGAGEAAELLSTLPEWKKARVVKSNP
ncbi:MAG TPA: 5-formyltetrahydrofolate cyclo-ligase, partial [Thermodesulfobacteriota bacterium]|nr:5-formyltetrahydrofolate cyclo-ligase [Thermodesulfobacteriota bacterium]